MTRLFLLACCCLLLSAPSLRAQDMDLNKFVAALNKGIELNDDKMIDRAVKDGARFAVQYYQTLKVEAWGGSATAGKTMAPLRASIKRCFESDQVCEKIERWVDSQSHESYDAYVKARRALDQCYELRDNAFKNNTDRKITDDAVKSVVHVAESMQQTGHQLDTGEAWSLAAALLTRAPDRTVDDRRSSITYLEMFLDARRSWYWTQDRDFLLNDDFVKKEKVALEVAAKDQKARAAAGYDPNAKGVDALLMPNAADDVHELEFEMLKDWEQLDYSLKGGPQPSSWWQGNLDNQKNATQTQLPWFQKAKLFLMRDSQTSTRYSVSTHPEDPKRGTEIEVGVKGKPTQFWLDDAKALPYAMFFWTGTDKEHIGEADVNLSPVPENTPIFYRSAASWHTHVGNDKITFYDDNGNGTPLDPDPSKDQFKLYSLGQPDDGQVVPLFDSMQIGKGPRVPFSEFVQIGGVWNHLRLHSEGKVALRQFNPIYLKTGKVKLTWNPKPSAPVQLVIQGKGEYSTAFFDVAGGKEVDVPAAEYQVVYGRILIGKGARAQTATIWHGSSKPFTVTAEKVTELKMGAPFGLSFERGGKDQDVEIDGAKIVLTESSGCLLAEPQNMVPVPEVLAAKAVDGKGAKAIGKFVKLDDPELLNKAAAKHDKLRLFIAYFPMPEGVRDGSLTLKCRTPAPGMKVGLSIKKHPVFGKVDSEFK